MKIYTKKGDEGITDLQGSKRVSKSDPRIIAYGSIDEVNSILGIVVAHDPDTEIKKLLVGIQNDLFVLGADLSNPALSDSENRVTTDMIEILEKKIDGFENVLTPLKNFIIPGGSIIASHIHHARAVTRRAETKIIELEKKEVINSNCRKYLNRLSDLLFVLARTANNREGNDDVFWNY